MQMTHYSVKNVFGQTTVDIGERFAIFVKTNNPSYKTIEVLDASSHPGSSTGGSTIEKNYSEKYYNGVTYISGYRDVKYADDDSRRLIAGGYLSVKQLSKSGIYHFAVFENGRRVSGTDITIRVRTQSEAEAAEDEWMNSVINSVCNSSMTETEKLDAIAKYLNTQFHYTAWYNGHALYMLAEECGVYYKNKTMQCIQASLVMCSFAKKLGIDAHPQNATSSAGYHANITAYVDGKWKTFDAAPRYDTSGQVCGTNYDLSKIHYVL